MTEFPFSRMITKNHPNLDFDDLLWDPSSWILQAGWIFQGAWDLANHPWLRARCCLRMDKIRRLERWSSSYIILLDTKMPSQIYHTHKKQKIWVYSGTIHVSHATCQQLSPRCSPGASALRSFHSSPLLQTGTRSGAATDCPWSCRKEWRNWPPWHWSVMKE